MAVANEAEVLAEVHRRIAVCRETCSESLDLSNLGLTCVPEEVAKLDWLRELNLKNERWITGCGALARGQRALSGLLHLTSLNLEKNWIGARRRAGVVQPC